MRSAKATLIGLTAILLWSANVGLIKHVSEGFGAIAGAALIYTCSSLVLLFTAGFPKLSTFPRNYLIIGTVLFVSYEVCLSLSLGFSQNAQQAIEVGMVNYLWPAMTVVLGIIVNRQRVHWMIVPGIVVSLAGILLVLSGDKPLSVSQIISHISVNPLSYGLAFAGAMIWAVYCAVTQKLAGGRNGITFFFIITALTLWAKYLFSPAASVGFSVPSVISLVLAALAMGLGYGAWNIGILHGNAGLLATVSYFIPVLSAVLASVMLHSTLTLSFWQGTAMVCLGSLVCWMATRKANNKRLSAGIQRQKDV